MSDGNRDFAGSAARYHEETGGNVRPGELKLPVGGDAAKRAEQDGDAINEAHGIRTAPRGEFRGARSLAMSSSSGARMAEPAAAQPDLSGRKASDYLPLHLKAQLIAEGRLQPDGTLAERTSSQDVRSAVSTAAGSQPEAGSEPEGALGAVRRWFRKLF